jgi:hypothetical protein
MINRPEFGAEYVRQKIMAGKLKKQGIRQSYSVGAYNKYNETEQWIRISQGCPNQCPYCYEPKEEFVFPIPQIVRNKVKIMDMNLLSKPQALTIIQELGKKRVNGHVVRYELVCGIDWRFLTKEIAHALKVSRFQNIRLAWDYYLNDQYKIKDAIGLLLNVGYMPKDLMIFMICNWQVSYSVCLKKALLCAVWNIKISDCYFDGQTPPKIEPLGWTAEEIEDFRRRSRKHNQYVTFGIDPEVKVNKYQKRMFE